jgi:hypothetical protein
MSVHVGSSAAKAHVTDAPTRALAVHPPRPTRSVRLALLVALIVVQVAWTAVLLYTAFRVIGTLRGLS